MKECLAWEVGVRTLSHGGIKADDEVALSQVREKLQTRCWWVMVQFCDTWEMLKGQADDPEQFLLEWMAQVLVKQRHCLLKQKDWIYSSHKIYFQTFNYKLNAKEELK